MPEIIELVDRASRDPEFLQRLQQDPYGTAEAEGVAVSHDELQKLLGLENASQEEVAEALQARLSFASKGDPAPSPWGPAQAGSLGLPTS